MITVEENNITEATFLTLPTTYGYMWRTHAKTFKLNNNLNRVCHIYLVSNL